MKRVMEDPRSKPHAGKGHRLRAQRKELQASGVLSLTVAEIAKAAGVSLSGYNQWETGETWPKGERKRKLATLMGWTEQELDYGKPSGGTTVYAPSQHELHLLLLFNRLSPTRRKQIFDALTAEAVSSDTLQNELRGPLRPVPDLEVTRPSTSSPSKRK